MSLICIYMHYQSKISLCEKDLILTVCLPNKPDPNGLTCQFFTVLKFLVFNSPEQLREAALLTIVFRKSNNHYHILWIPSTLQ